MQQIKINIPYRFFIITFLWSWFFWFPFVLEQFDLYQLSPDLRSVLIFPALFIGAFGPAVGACVSVWSLNGKQELGKFLKTFLAIKFRWKVWVTVFIVLGGTNFIAW